MDYLTELSASTGVYRGLQVQQTVEAYREWAGLNKPVWQQYLHYLRNMLRLDFGNSLMERRPVEVIISWSLPWTIGLMGTTTLIALT